MDSSIDGAVNCGVTTFAPLMNGKHWAIRLLSVACLSLAAKMEECKVPSLSQYNIDDYNFESNVIQRMEFLVLNTLEWNLNSITPFAYLQHFITKFCLENRECKPKELVSGAVELILAISKGNQSQNIEQDLVLGFALVMLVYQFKILVQRLI